jgi:hypothetical protein
VPGLLDWPLEAPLLDGTPPPDPLPEPPVVVLGIAWAVVVLGIAWVAVTGFAKVVETPADTEPPVPSVTMPLRMTPPGVAAVCANAGQAAATAISTV